MPTPTGSAVLMPAASAALAAAALAGCSMFGPDTTTPTGYVEKALSVFDQGYYATGPAWEQARAETGAAAGRAATVADTYPALKKAIKVAGSKHSSFYTPTEGQALRGKGEEGSNVLPSAATATGITTLTVTELGSADEGELQRYADTLGGAVATAAPATTCGWIVDLRGNTGGNMYPMIAGLSSLLPDGKAIAFHGRDQVLADVSIEGNTVKVGGTTNLGHEKGGGKITQPVAVLQDDKTASSAEAVRLAFTGLPHVRFFGTPTTGVPTANEGKDLPDGAIANLTIAVDGDRTGKTYDSPIPPNEKIEDRAKQQPAAKAWLRSRCG